MSIDEFLDQYTPVELEKLERRDPLKRISEKTTIPKIAVENSPVRPQSKTTKTSPNHNQNADLDFTDLHFSPVKSTKKNPDRGPRDSAPRKEPTVQQKPVKEMDSEEETMINDYI